MTENKIYDQNDTLRGFTEALGSALPAPGGGGAAALCGALGTALLNMVGSLTTGKKRYAASEEDIQRMMAEGKTIADALLECIRRDAEDFLPLAAAYGIPKDDPKRAEVLERETMRALGAPRKMLDLICRASEFLMDYYQKGSRLAVSDVGCAAAMLRAAADAASLNVYINTKALTDRTTAETVDFETKWAVDRVRERADRVYELVLNDLKEGR
ncbi:MAG: cyclodeaminase/cyclohydrolase family protein [Clostridia bacterium]|nr:cyclodeaminase/cyclohydrolase family protein [Clostridia bacterium]